MNARELLAEGTPRPWVGKRDRFEDEIYTDFFAINGTDYSSALNIAGSDEDCALIVAAVNEYEAHVDVEEFARLVAEHYATIAPPGKLDAGMTRLKDALARLDALRPDLSPEENQGRRDSLEERRDGPDNEGA